MTFQDWIDTVTVGEQPIEFRLASKRKLHLLTAAFLRRVWDLLPSDHSRRAVEATEQFADGRITADALAWARSQAARESGDTVWVTGLSGDEYHLLEPWCLDPDEEARVARYERHVARRGGILDGVRRGLESPAVVAVGAAWDAFWREHPGLHRADWAGRCRAWRPLYEVACELFGPDDAAERFDPAWRTTDVIALAKGIHADQDFDSLPILADALQDAGCEDRIVLDHCRGKREHARGCWVVDLAMGVS